jgi:hypothetical protein
MEGWGHHCLLHLSEIPLLLPLEVVVVTGPAAMEPLIALRMMVERTAAETMTTGTWTTAHTRVNMAARRASMTMTTPLKSRVQR